MKKENIYVVIDSVEKQQKAVEILNRYGEKIWEDECAMDFDEFDKFLRFDVSAKSVDWVVDNFNEGLIEVTFEDLEAILYTTYFPKLKLWKAHVSFDGNKWELVEGFGVYNNNFLTDEGVSYPLFKPVVEDPKYIVLRPCLWFCKGDTVEVKDLNKYFLQGAIEKLIEDEFIKLV